MKHPCEDGMAAHRQINEKQKAKTWLITVKMLINQNAQYSAAPLRLVGLHEGSGKVEASKSGR